METTFSICLFHKRICTINRLKSHIKIMIRLKWTDVTNHDIRKFLGLIILMGQTQKSHWKEYWSSDPLLKTPIFAKTMTRRRFEQIMTFLHFNNNSQTSIPTNRISKLRILLDYFLPKFQSIYIPRQELSLDRAMIS